MKIKGGYHKRILYIDLSSGEKRILEFDDAFAIQYIGGRGFGAKLLWDQMNRKKDLGPLSPENIITIAPTSMMALRNSWLKAVPAAAFI